ncbi:kinase-like protein, partial [Clavulina sp. PMI_390]
ITHSQLKHKNIIPFLGIYQEDAKSPPLTVVPYIQRGSLSDLLDKALHRLDSKTFQRILLGVSCGVDYLHSLCPCVIHGDLHPGNVLIGESGEPYLCDFGLSRIRHEVTRVNSMLGHRQGGNFRYMAPELCEAEGDRFRTSRESDIFSLGMTFLHICSGQKPFHSVGMLVVPGRVASGQRPTQPTFAVDVPESKQADLWKLIQEMWGHDPAGRPPSTDIVKHLERMFPIALNT